MAGSPGLAARPVVSSPAPQGHLARRKIPQPPRALRAGLETQVGTRTGDRKHLLSTWVTGHNHHHHNHHTARDCVPQVRDTVWAVCPHLLSRCFVPAQPTCFQGSPCGPGHHSVLSKGVPLSSSSPPPLLDVPASAPSPRQPEGPHLVHSRPSRMPVCPLTAPAPWPVPSLSPHHMQVPSVRPPRAPSLRHLGESLAACKASLRHQLPDLPASKIYNLPPSPERPHLPTPTSPTDVLGLLSALRVRTYRCGSDVSLVLHREWVRRTVSLLLAPGTQPEEASIKAH